MWSVLLSFLGPQEFWATRVGKCAIFLVSVGSGMKRGCVPERTELSDPDARSLCAFPPRSWCSVSWPSASPPSSSSKCSPSLTTSLWPCGTPNRPSGREPSPPFVPVWSSPPSGSRRRCRSHSGTGWGDGSVPASGKAHRPRVSLGLKGSSRPLATELASCLLWSYMIFKLTVN